MPQRTKGFGNAVVLLRATLAITLLVSAGCGKSTTTSSGSGRYWNVVLAGNSIARLTFGTPLSSGGNGIIGGGSVGTYSASDYNLYVSGGGTVCQMVETAGTVVVAPGGQTGTFTLTDYCAHYMSSSLQITLGNSLAAILDADNNYVVEAGRSSVGYIVAPGETGASTGNITY